MDGVGCLAENGSMDGDAKSRRRMAWLAVAFLMGAGCAGLGLIFALQGLERADQLASVVGVFVGLAGLGVAIYSAWLGHAALAASRQGTSPDPAGAVSTAQGSPSPEGSQSVSGSIIAGDNIQIGHAGGDVKLDRE
jgi:hypothetical protein